MDAKQKTKVELLSEIKALRQRNHELILLNEAALAFNSTLELDTIFVTVLEKVRVLLNVTASSIWLIDHTTNELVCRQASGDGNNIVSGWRLSMDQGIVGWVAQHGTNLIVADAWTDDRHFIGVSKETRVPIRSIISVPLKAKQKVLGVIQVLDTKVNRFTEDDLALLTPLTNTASIAIDNARLHEALHQHAQQLQDRVQERTAELAAQTARQVAILNSTTDGIVITDAKGSIVSKNPVAQTLLEETLTPEDAQKVHDTVHALITKYPEKPRAELSFKGLDIELKAAPVSGGDLHEPSYVVSIHDVSQLKALNRIKTEFITNVSHELRTPATEIKLCANIMERRPDKVNTYLPLLSKAAEHQAQLVEGIFQIANIDAGRQELRRTRTSVNDCIKTIAEAYIETAHQQGQDMKLQLTQLEPIANLDCELMDTAVRNLIRNALQFTPTGGHIVISTNVSTRAGRRWVTITVKDNGIGIPDHEQPLIFQRFFRGEYARQEQIPGTGLGLAIAKEITELHGGWITSESEIGQGSIFTIGLPLAAESGH